jgi:predicted metal-binding protein
MKADIDFRHCIEERTIEEIKEYFHPEVFIEYCKNCKHYNKIWSCPPYDFNVLEIIDRYKYVNIIGSKIYINSLGESFKELLNHRDVNYASNEIYEAARKVLDEKLMAIENGKDDLCALFAGRCIVCNRCTREEQKPCINPEKMHFSLESMGFDVASICKDILGDKIQWAKEGLPEYFILISAIFSKEKLHVEYVNKIMML